MFCFSRGHCKVPTLLRGQAEACEEQQLSHTCQCTAFPQNKAGAPLLMPLGPTRYSSCFLSDDLHTLNRNLQPFCTCLVLGTVGTRQLTAPWRRARQGGTPNPTLQVHPSGSEPATSCDCGAMLFKSQFGHYANCL